jgi:hypothetical protein
MTENHFDTYVKHLKALHVLLAQGKDDSPEADEIRDQMDEPWRHLTENEKQKLRNLSESLYKKHQNHD